MTSPRTKTFTLLAALLAASCATTSAGPAPSAEAELPMPPELRAETKRVAALGRELYILDEVSALATDVVMERVPDFRESGVAGWLPVREGEADGRIKGSFMVTFFTRDDPPRIAYQVRIKPKAQPELMAFSPPKPGTDSFVTLVRARQAAIAARPPSTQPLNPVVVPGAANGEKGILVYLLAGTKVPDTAVFGQHFRVLMPEEGGAPTYVMPLSRSALVMSTRAPDGSKPEALMVTHLVTDWPLETHVLVSLQMHVPVYVGTEHWVWRVDGDRIALIDRRQPGEKK